jgi:hypothetical protein
MRPLIALCLLLAGCGGTATVSGPTLIARPEVDGVNLLQAGDTIAFPLYDGQVAYASPNLHRISNLTITPHELFTDLGYSRVSPPPGMSASQWNVGSSRAVLFKATKPGHGVVLVALTLPNLHQRCVSCRTLHYFFDVEQPGPLFSRKASRFRFPELIR